MWLLAGCLAWVGCGDVDTPRAKLDELAAQSAGVGPYQRVCAGCHGPTGKGNESVRAPSIAGLPSWYVEEQIFRFREGKRGAHPEDLPGQQMRAIALSLTEDQITTAAGTVSAMESIPTEAPPENADLERGRHLYANHCMECHRYNGQGERVFHSAPLVSLNRGYLRRQLENYRAGLRGAQPGDIYGQKMVTIASRLGDEEIEDLVHYIGALAHGDDPRPAMER